MTLSVLVLTAWRTDQLRRCLEALEAGTRRPDEVVLVIDRDDTETREAVGGWSFPFPLLPIEGAGDYARRRNDGVRRAGGDRVAVLDDDCCADRFWLERMEAALAENDAAGGPVLPAEELPAPDHTPPDCVWLAGISPPGIWSELGGRVFLPSTSNLAFRREVWEEIPFQETPQELAGGDSENYHAGREDAQWWRDVRRAGKRCTIAGRALVWHDIPAERLEREKMAERAEADGLAAWRRAPSPEVAEYAARDVAHFPFRVLADSLVGESPAGEAWRAHRLWTKRQNALLHEAVRDYDGHFTPQNRAGILLKETGGVLASEAKALARGAAAFAWTSARPRGPLPDVDNPPSRISVVCYNFLGDTVLLFVMLEQLRVAFPESEIAVICGELTAPLFEDTDWIDELVVLPDGLSAKKPADMRRVYDAVREADPDLVILTYLHGASPAALFAATDAPLICWDHDHGMRQRVWSNLASVRVPKDLERPEVASLLDLLAPLGVETELRRPRLAMPQRARERADEVLRRKGLHERPFAVIHVDNQSYSSKVWPAERFALLARHLYERHQLAVVFVGTRHGRGLYEMMDLDAEHFVSFHGMLDVAEVGAVMERARVCCGIDSGPMHLAQAVGAPALVLFGPVRENQWGPLPQLPHEDAPPPIRTVRAPDAPVDWLDEETIGLPPNERIMRLRVEQVCRAADRLLQETEGSP